MAPLPTPEKLKTETFEPMPQLMRGQKIKLADLTPNLQLRAGIGASSPALSFDISCFGVDSNGKLSDDRYFIFFNQRASPESALRMVGSQSGDAETFEIDLSKLPTSIQKLVFVLTVDGAGEMKSLQSGYFRLEAGGSEVARFPFAGSDFGVEKAIMVAEVYKKDVWRLAAVGQGFAGGLDAVLKHFGGEQIGAAQSASTPSAPPVAIPPAPPMQPRPTPPVVAVPVAASAPAQPKVNLGKVTLDKKGEKTSISLNKGGGVQPVRVNLNWEAPAKKGFLAALTGSAPDLDLGCMFRLKNGNGGVIQPLGNYFGSQNSEPFIYLDKDDRSGAAQDGENLTIFRPDQIDTVMIFALIYQGAPDFTSVNGRVTLKDQNGNEILIQLGAPERGLGFCSVATIRNVGGHIEITKEERYFKGHMEADRHFGFGFNWKAGSK